MGATPQAKWSRLLICEHCDTVHHRCNPVSGEVTRCVRCNAVLERYHSLNVDGMLAVVLTALIVFLIANVWPIVTLGLGTRQSSATLWGIIIVMWQHHSQVVSVLVAATLFFFPLGKILMAGWLLSYARGGRRAPGFRPAMVVLHYMQPWTMTEVFLLGVLVAIVKVRNYFDVMADPGIYAFAMLMMLITIFSGINLRRLWDMTPERYS